jgi:glutamate--cysteine ligase
LEAGCKPASAFRLGAEHEKIPFYLADHTPVPYAGPRGIGALLSGMRARLGWDAIEDESALIGLYDPAGGGAISLEPGGQFELSGAPQENIHEVAGELATHLTAVREVATGLGIGFLCLGMSPKWTLAETPVMPKSRYRIMTNYMPRVGTRGLDMMYRTATVQANLDFSDEADMVAKMRVGLALQPMITALFANSPFTGGGLNGFLSARSEIWRDTDPARSGMLPFAFEPGMGFERYVDYALDVPMYFVKREGRYIDVAGRSFRDFMDGKLDAVPGERPTIADWVDHTSTIFPEVRLKQYLEMRGADAGPWSRLCALPALWAGLLYDPAALAAAWDICKGWTPADRGALREDATRLALKATVNGRSVQGIAVEMLALAREGLRRRNRLSAGMVDETGYLEELEDIAETGLTAAERLLELYHGPWQGNAGEVFDTFAY